MSLESLKNRLPDYARDLKLNLGSLAAEPGLTEQQRAGTFIASALAAREPSTIRAILAEFGPQLSPEALTAAKAAAAIMGMNNIYYRFVHLMGEGNDENQYKTLPAKLRMNVIGKPGVEKVDFELWSLAVSAVKGCGMCLVAHEHELRKAGMTAEQVQQAARIAAVVHAVAVTLDGETAMGEALAEAAE
ncbi:MAG: carboxymuconolactone decarboxylase family protein [Ferrovibrio sp.]|uniref:carboxymuconolactone decarboxylase family protein n=1 Tax=Ferrovibrio sp. TaxID=1917215 RepID=UPI0039187554